MAKTPLINPQVQATLRHSPTRKIDALREKLASEGKDVILLSTGQPGIPPVRQLRDAVAKLLEEETMKYYGYTPSNGVRPLREAIAEDIKGLGGPDLDPDQIVVTAGGQHAMFSALASILEPGTEVVMADPTYFGYEPLIKYFGAKPVYVETRLEEEYQPSPEAIAERINGKTRAILLVTPDNPTGRVIRPEVAKALAELAQDHGLWLLVDEAYKTLIYEGSHVWPYKHAPENVAGINTFSKDPGFPGWRLGYIYGPPSIIAPARLVAEEAVYCPPSIAQYAALIYIREGLRRYYLAKAIPEYVRRRDTMAKALEKHVPGARFLKAKGSMFMLADLREYLEPAGMGAEQFSKKLLEEKLVATIPGTYFGQTPRYSVRLSFATETPERIAEAIERMGELLQEL